LVSSRRDGSPPRSCRAACGGRGAGVTTSGIEELTPAGADGEAVADAPPDGIAVAVAVPVGVADAPDVAVGVDVGEGVAVGKPPLVSAGAGALF